MAASWCCKPPQLLWWLFIVDIDGLFYQISIWTLASSKQSPLGADTVEYCSVALLCSAMHLRSGCLVSLMYRSEQVTSIGHVILWDKVSQWVFFKLLRLSWLRWLKTYTGNNNRDTRGLYRDLCLFEQVCHVTGPSIVMIINTCLVTVPAYFKHAIKQILTVGLYQILGQSILCPFYLKDWRKGFSSSCLHNGTSSQSVAGSYVFHYSFRSQAPGIITSIIG